MLNTVEAQSAVMSELEAFDRFLHLYKRATLYDIGAMCLYLASMNMEATLRTLLEAWNVVRPDMALSNE